ncbi:MAG: tRNA uridine(34) 5-carboxymethylaminomethyl modification radical SAM/GNAT enzyme Elp3 [Candidatus Aenigmarchaeota archaeon]|nr:tRNA uridine(34) 5-carboxymethylaminomethyl modification radical SAM/GNAT enzyme Elp3 [Candidatus Aenigmarchaeota archaeon]
MQELSSVDILSLACKELAAKILSREISSPQVLEIEKIRIAKKYSLGTVIKNADILLRAESGEPYLKKFLKTKPVRTLSGVANIAVMWLGTDGFSCPFKCIFCPQGNTRGVKVFTPKSYTGCEPTTLRAIRNNYDPYLQVTNRLKQLGIIGHATDKCELIIMGGTFLSWHKQNQGDFIKRCFDAFNSVESSSLVEAQKINETAKNRCIGLTVETRSDYCSPKDIEWMLCLGTTRVEIGVQTTDDELLSMVKRSNNAQSNVEAIKRLKEAGIKVTAHWMPGLTGLEKLDMKKEIRDFRKLFDNPDYRPDELKIYPALVIPGTELHELWKKGDYQPLSTSQFIDLLIELKRLVPKYVRVKRVMRDISEHESAAGASTTNIRQLVHEKMAKAGAGCRCIRCREVGQNRSKPEKIELQRFDYEASGGKEIFLSFEDSENDILVAFLRLRIDADSTAKVRELHVYGEMMPIGGIGAWQHKGFGKKLLEEAEAIAKEFGKNRVQVTSGVGAREYYRKLGYGLEGFYMVKEL